jgi:putative ABC transport system permease protein
MAVNPSYADLSVTVVLLIAVLILSWREQLDLGRAFLHASIRTVVQLVLAGYLIEYVFNLGKWYLVLALLSAMSFVAAHEGAKRLSPKLKHAATMTWAAIFVGTSVNTFVVTEMILKAEPWWSPRYLIPLAGMIMGNALNSGSLAGERFASDLRARTAEVETLLSLGFSSKDAMREIKRNAVRSALIPTLNSMLTVGIVALPGMMTGQILGGASPSTAVKYQIIVMFMIPSTVLVTALILIALLMRSYFTKAEQLRHNLL